MYISLLLTGVGIACVACVPIDPVVHESLQDLLAKLKPEVPPSAKAINATEQAEQVTPTKDETKTTIDQGSVVDVAESNQNKQPKKYTNRAYGFPNTFGVPNKQPSYSNREYVNFDGTPYNGFSPVPTDFTGGVPNTGYPSNYWATYGSSPYGYNPYGSPYSPPYSPYGSPYGNPYGPYGYGGRSHGGHSRHHG